MKFAMFQDQVVFGMINRLFNSELPVKVAYNLSKVQKTIGAENEKYQELRMKIINKYGEKDEEGNLIADELNNVKLAEDSYEDVLREMTELHEIEFDLPRKFNIDDFASINLSANDIGILDLIGLLEE